MAYLHSRSEPWELGFPGGWPLLGWPGLGEGVPARISLRHFTCSDGDRTAIEKALAMSISLVALRGAVETAIGNAVTWARAAADALGRGARTAATRRLFQEAFGTTPEFVPSWRPAGQSWDRGDVVRARLLRAAGILAGGSIHYFCWGSKAHCPECDGAETGYYACSSWGKRYVICLGVNFWRDWKRGDSVSMASTMLHEALHIYFGHLVAHGETGPYGDANCYARFALLANGQSLPARVSTRCPVATLGELGLPCVYGRWCGPGCSGPGTPIDDVDVCCKQHDECYGRRGYFACGCNRALLDCVRPKIGLGTAKGRAALAVWSAFKAMPCRSSP